jgi:hypothetical protein
MLEKLLKIGLLAIVSGLLIGHGTPMKPRTELAWFVSDEQTVRCEITPATPIRRYRVEIVSENNPLQTVLWNTKIGISMYPVIDGVPLEFNIKDAQDKVLSTHSFTYRKKYAYSMTRRYTRQIPDTKSGTSAYLLAHCTGNRCVSDDILEVRLVNPGYVEKVNLSLRYHASISGPTIEVNIWKPKPKMPDGLNIKLKLTELP